MFKTIKPKEAAAMLGVSGQTIRLWILNGTLPALRIGSRYRIDEAVIQDILINGTPRHDVTATEK